VSVAEIVVRVDQLRGQLGLTRTAGTSAASGARFAATLNSVQGAGSTAGASTGADAVASAKKYLGVPYVWGGTDPAKGLDCSGLMLRAYGDLGVKLPRTAAEQARTGTAVPNLAAAKPGDLLAFNSPVDHIAMYIGDGMMIAAPKPGDKVKIEKVYQTPSTIRRVLPEAAAASGLPTMGLQPANLRAATTANTVSGVPYADLFNAAGARYGVSPKLLAAVAKVESGYNPRAVSNSGAQGLMQIMPGTAKGLGVTNAFDPAQAVDGAAKLLARNLRDFGSVDLAVAAYNAGGGAVRKYHGIPPYAQTQAYVPKVKAALAALGGGS
jgi:soluble lytic murein transglycosylase-like protein